MAKSKWQMAKALGLVMGLALLALTSYGQASVKIQQKAEAYSGVLLLTITNTVATTIWTNANNSVTQGRILYRGIQNTGTNAFLYLIVGPNLAGSTNAALTNVSSTNYTGVVAGGLATRDGVGGIVDLSKVPWPVSVITESGVTAISAVELTQ